MIFLDTVTQTEPTARATGITSGERITSGRNPLIKRTGLKIVHFLGEVRRCVQRHFHAS